MGGLSRFTKLMMVTVSAVSQVPRISTDLDRVGELIDAIKKHLENLKTAAVKAGVHPDVIIRECRSCQGQDIESEIADLQMRYYALEHRKDLLGAQKVIDKDRERQLLDLVAALVQACDETQKDIVGTSARVLPRLSPHPTTLDVNAVGTPSGRRIYTRNSPSDPELLIRHLLGFKDIPPSQMPPPSRLSPSWLPSRARTPLPELQPPRLTAIPASLGPTTSISTPCAIAELISCTPFN